MQKKILKVVFVLVGALTVLTLIVIFLPLLILALLLGLVFGKLKIGNINALKNRSYGVPGEEEINTPSAAFKNNASSIDYQDDEIIDIQAEEVKEK